MVLLQILGSIYLAKIPRDSILATISTFQQLNRFLVHCVPKHTISQLKNEWIQTSNATYVDNAPGFTQIQYLLK